jgi:hypothetical protein
MLALSPIGSIIAWHKDILAPQIPKPTNWMECNGQIVNDNESPLNGITLPNLNGDRRFLRGGAISGTLQDCANLTHTHTATAGSTQPRVISTKGNNGLQHVQVHHGHPPDGIDYQRVAVIPHVHGVHGDIYAENHTHAIAVTETGNSESRPVNMSIVWIIRIK